MDEKLDHYTWGAVNHPFNPLVTTNHGPRVGSSISPDEG